jgi:Holliday junction resolvase RusA-like endonuclease
VSTWGVNLKKGAVFECRGCGKTVLRKSPMHRYCVECSNRKHNENRGLGEPATKGSQRSLDVLRGEQINAATRQTLPDMAERPDYEWLIRYSVPFTYAASKNAIWAMRAGGHVYMRQQARSFRNELIAATNRALEGRRVFNNKVWIRLHCEKPNHRGDAINVIDAVADALKEAAGVDDRWFCIDRVDWSIVKSDPRLYVSIAQAEAWDATVCSHCGRILPTETFPPKKGTKTGRDRVCTDCSNQKRADLVIFRAQCGEKAA